MTRRVPPPFLSSALLSLLALSCAVQSSSPPHTTTSREALTASSPISGALSFVFDGGVISGTCVLSSSGGPSAPDASPAPSVDAAAPIPTPDAGAAPARDGGGLAGLFETYAPSPGMAPPGARLTPPALALPAPLATYVDAPFGTTIQRGPAGTWNDYSQLNADSSDGAYWLLINAGGYYVARSSDWSPVPAVKLPAASLRWDPVRNRVIGIVGPGGAPGVTAYSVVAWEVPSGAFSILVATPFQAGGQSIVQEELSRDGRSMALLGYVPGTNTHSADTVMVADVVAGRVTTSIPLAGLCGGKTTSDIDFVKSLRSLTAIQWHADGAGPCNGLQLYDNTTGARVRQLHQHHAHGDWGEDASGREFYLTVSLASSVNNNYPGVVAEWVDGAAPREVRMTGWYAVEHISCRGAPGVCLISGAPGVASLTARPKVASATADPLRWQLKDAAFEVLRARHLGKPAPKEAAALLRAAFPASLKAAGALEPLSGEEWVVDIATGSTWRVAFHRTTACSYYHQPHGSLTHDGRFAIVASDWQTTGCDDAKLSPFVIRLRQ